MISEANKAVAEWHDSLVPQAPAKSGCAASCIPDSQLNRDSSSQFSYLIFTFLYSMITSLDTLQLISTVTATQQR